MKNKRKQQLAVIVGFLAMAGTLHAFPIAPPGTEGSAIIASGGLSVVVTAAYEGNSASYNNDLYLEFNALGLPGMDGDQSNDLFIFNNHGTPVGTTIDLGSFADGTELVFRLHVNDTGNDFYSGDPSRNPDGLPHARVQDDWAPNTTLVSFEDLLNLPEGDAGFNDLSFSFTNTRSEPPDVADPASTLALLGASLAGLSLIRRHE